MNKDEMKKDLINILENQCNNAPYDYCIGCNCNECRARVLTNAGYRKIADDEIVVKKSEYEKLANDLDKGDYGEFENGFSQGYAQGKQETREILQAINKYLVGTRGIYTVKTFRNCRFEDIMLVRADDLETLVKKLAKEHDVELED